MSDRKKFIEILRVLATCAVVLLHTVTGIMDITDMSAYPVQRTVFVIIMDLVTWCVPVFLMISGYLFLNPKREITMKQVLTKYCRRIVLALFLFGVPFACMELTVTEGTFRVNMVGRAFLMVCKGQSWSHMWYLYTILALYLITPALKKILSLIPRGSLYLILGFLVLGSSLFPFLNKLFNVYTLPMLSDGWIYLFYYLCGYLFLENKGRQSVYPAVGLGLLFAGLIGSRLIGDYSLQMAYNYPFTVLAALLVFEIALSGESVLKQKNTALLTYAGTLCFTVYLIHPVFVNVFYKFLHLTPLDFPIGISLPVFFLIILVLSFGGSYVLYKIPVLRKYCL